MTRVDRIQRLIDRHRRIDESCEAIAESWERNTRLRDREESRLMRVLRETYPGKTVLSGGKAYSLIEDELHVHDVVDLDEIEDVEEFMNPPSGRRCYQTCNPDWNPGDLWDHAVISDGEVS